MPFEEVDGLVGGLPVSATEHRAWVIERVPRWEARHVQAQAWLNAGREVEHVGVCRMQRSSLLGALATRTMTKSRTVPGHEAAVRPTASGRRFVAECSCGYLSTSRSTKAMAVAAAVH